MPPRRASRKVAAAPKQTAAAPRWLRPLMLALAAILLLALFSGEIRDTDIWLHLKTGQHTLETRALTVPDPFSYTSGMGAPKYAGEEVTRYFNLTHEWLAQIVMYLIYAVAGFPGLVLARAVLLMIFCALVGWIAYRRSGGFAISVAAALVAAAVAFHFQQSRPFLVTFVFLAVTMAVLESRRWMWALPAVFLIWANCHAGFFMGWLLFAAYCAEALIGRLRKRPVEAERRLWQVAAACLLVSALNPNGFRVIQVVFFYQRSEIQSTNLEWQRPIFWRPDIYGFVLFGSLAALVSAWRRARPADWLLYLGFAAISLMAVRNVIFLGLVAPVVMAAYAPRWRWLPPAAVLLAAAALLGYDVAPAVASGNTFAFRAAQWQLPSGAADFIEAHRVAGRMFNTYESGGYLVWRLWPLHRDFIDPRGLSEEAYADYRHILMNTDASGAKGAAGLLEKYGIQMAVLEGFDYLSGQVYPLAAEMADPRQREWKLVFADAQSLVFMRHPPPGVEPLNARDAVLESLSRQCDEHMRHDPGRPRCARGLSEYFAFVGDTDQGRRWMDRYLEHRVEADAEAQRIDASLRVTSWNNQALEMESKGDLAGAEALFRSAVALAEKTLGPDHPDTAGSLNNLAGLLESKGDAAGAEALYRRALAICEKTLGPDDPHTAASLDNLAGLLEAKGDLAGAEPLYRRALAIAEKALGRDHPTTQGIREELHALGRKRTR
jgi:tetratricopeptide (TPR) repeat protein